MSSTGTYSTLCRLKDQIYDDYLSAPGTEIVYIRRLAILRPDRPAPSSRQHDCLGEARVGRSGAIDSRPPTPERSDRESHPATDGYVPGQGLLSAETGPDRSLNGPGLSGLLRFSGPSAEFEPEDAWESIVHKLELGPVTLIHRIDGGVPSPSPEYLLCREGEIVAAKRFATHLRVLGRFLRGCQQSPDSAFCPPPQLLDVSLRLASVSPEEFWLGVACYHFRRYDNRELRLTNNRWDDGARSAFLSGELDWAEGDYFFVLEGDARYCAVRCIDFYLDRHGDGAPIDRGYGTYLPGIPGNGVDGLERSVDRADWARPVSDSIVTRVRPRWERQSRTLSCGGIRCRKFLREADRQFPILDAFEREDWPDHIEDPFNLDALLRQTIDDLNSKLEGNSPIRFRVINHRANWYFVATGSTQPPDHLM